MAGNLYSKRGIVNTNICEFVIDCIDEINYLPTTTAAGTGLFKDIDGFKEKVAIGSHCIVGNENSNAELYMLFSFGWKKVKTLD